MKYNKIENKLKFDYNNMMASYIGENGFTEKDLAEMNAPAKAAFNFVSENRGTRNCISAEIHSAHIQKETVTKTFSGNFFR